MLVNFFFDTDLESESKVHDLIFIRFAKYMKSWFIVTMFILN